MGEHLFRLSEVARALRDGVLYPRFLPDAFSGLGAPILNFNPVAPYYLPALLVLAGMGPILALKISAGAVMIAGGVAVRVLARPHLGRSGAAVAGLAYVFLPYRIADLYVRMAYSELAAMVLLPLAMAAARRAVRGPTPRRIAVATAALAAVPATHFPSSVIGLPAVLLYALACAKRGSRLRVVAPLAATFVLALMMSAFSWLPALAEQSGTHYEDSTTGMDDYRKHFIDWPQLFSTRWGFGSSLPGSRDQMSFQVGWVHIAGLVLGAAAAYRIRTLRPLLAFCAVVAVGGSLLMLQAARPLWDLLWVLQNVQFPWRILMLVGLATSLALGAAAAAPSFSRVPGSVFGAEAARSAGTRLFGSRLVGSAAPVAAAVMLMAACLPYLQARRGKGSDSDFTPEGIRSHYFGELKFQPIEVAAPMFRPEGPRASLAGEGAASIIEEKTHRTTVDVAAPSATTLRLHVFNTPGWVARAGDEALPVRTEPRTGLVLVDVPAGSHRIVLVFGNTPVRRVAWMLSLLGAIAAGAAAVWRQPPERRSG